MRDDPLPRRGEKSQPPRVLALIGDDQDQGVIRVDAVIKGQEESTADNTANRAAPNTIGQRKCMDPFEKFGDCKIEFLDADVPAEFIMIPSQTPEMGFSEQGNTDGERAHEGERITRRGMRAISRAIDRVWEGPGKVV